MRSLVSSWIQACRMNKSFTRGQVVEEEGVADGEVEVAMEEEDDLGTHTLGG